MNSFREMATHWSIHFSEGEKEVDAGSASVRLKALGARIGGQINAAKEKYEARNGKEKIIHIFMSFVCFVPSRTD